MNNDPRSHGLWEASAPPAPHCPPLTAEIEADVAIVGAGYTGLSAALHLAQGGASAAVIEAIDIGYGGSGRNVGLVNAGMWVQPDALGAALGPEYGPRLLRLLGEAPALVFDIARRQDIDCEALRNGTLHCAVGASGLREITERARQWQALGAPVRLLDAEETRHKTGARVYRGALLDERAGTIQPLAYARGLARAALARLFPQLTGIGFEHEWYGSIGMTANALPRLHRLGRNMVSFSGYNGRGIAPGTTFGRELARLALGEMREDELPLPITDIAAAPLRGLRELGYELGAQAVHALDARL